MLFAVFVVWCVAMSVVDWRERRLPNRLTLPGAVFVLVAGLLLGHGQAVVVGAALLFGLYLLIHVVAPRAMGAGDVKAAIGLGGAVAIAGAHAWLLAALLAPVLTVAVCAVRRERDVPHGPSMCGAAIFAILACR